MAHKRKQIRDAVVQALKTGPTDAGQDVFADRLKSLKSIEYPSIVVFNRSESAEVDTDGTRTYLRKLQCVVEACTRPSLEQDGSADDDLEDLAEQIELVFAATPQWGLDFVLDTKLLGTELDFSTAGEKPLGVVQLTYEILYLST